jgi:hypothetical protein
MAYEYRGLICRLFGVSVYTDKKGQKKLLTCKKSKAHINKEDLYWLLKLPEMSFCYSKLIGIDPYLATSYYPINISVKKAIEMVLFYFQYRNKRA